MGYNYASDLASGDFVHDLERQISIHFSSNCYPPVPQFMVEPAIEAIKAINDGDNPEIELPSGVEFRGSSTATAWEIANNLRLHAWLEQE